MGTTTHLLLLCALAGLACAYTRTPGTYCWTKWLDRDSPSGTGDWETLRDFPPSQVCPQPVGIECQTRSGQPYQSTGETVTCEPRVGLVCQNRDQTDRYCQDYRVRFLCPAGTIDDTTGISCTTYCETQWLDRDNPSGYCDCETIRDFNPSQICPNPIGIKCRERSTGQDYRDVGQTMTCNVQSGGVCWNHENTPNSCRDYEVQFICPGSCTYSISQPAQVEISHAGLTPQ